MTTRHAQDPDDAGEPATGPSPRESAPGVEIGLSDEAGGTSSPRKIRTTPTGLRLTPARGARKLTDITTS